MDKVPVDPKKSKQEAWAISGMKAKCGDEEEDLYRLFTPKEYSVSEVDITLYDLQKGDWTIIIVHMSRDGIARQSVVKTVASGESRSTTLTRPSPEIPGV